MAHSQSAASITRDMRSHPVRVVDRKWMTDNTKEPGVGNPFLTGDRSRIRQLRGKGIWRMKHQSWNCMSDDRPYLHALARALTK